MANLSRRASKAALRKYVTEMSDEWCVPCEVVFKNGSWGSWAATRAAGSSISFGMRGAQSWARRGFREHYKTAAHLIKGKPKGRRSHRYLAAHEFAHILTDHLYEHYVSPHGREWREAYETLLKMHVPGYDRSNGNG